jgi:hypothetical protein
VVDSGCALEVPGRGQGHDGMQGVEASSIVWSASSIVWSVSRCSQLGAYTAPSVSQGGDMSNGERGCDIEVRCVGEIMQAEGTA